MLSVNEARREENRCLTSKRQYLIATNNQQAAAGSRNSVTNPLAPYVASTSHIWRCKYILEYVLPSSMRLGSYRESAICHVQQPQLATCHYSISTIAVYHLRLKRCQFARLPLSSKHNLPFPFFYYLVVLSRGRCGNIEPLASRVRHSQRTDDNLLTRKVGCILVPKYFEIFSNH